MRDIKTVPNQRVLLIKKEPAGKNNLYTVNNLDALDEAAFNLQSKGGFKLYVYFAKNQDKYQFALSSKDFLAWSGLGIAAYNTAFDELVEKGYLVETAKNRYTFYDKSQKEKKEKVIIDIPEEKVKEIRNIKDNFIF